MRREREKYIKTFTILLYRIPSNLNMQREEPIRIDFRQAAELGFLNVSKSHLECAMLLIPSEMFKKSDSGVGCKFRTSQKCMFRSIQMKTLELASCELTSSVIRKKQHWLAAFPKQFTLSFTFPTVVVATVTLACLNFLPLIYFLNVLHGWQYIIPLDRRRR